MHQTILYARGSAGVVYWRKEQDSGSVPSSVPTYGSRVILANRTRSDHERLTHGLTPDHDDAFLHDGATYSLCPNTVDVDLARENLCVL